MFKAGWALGKLVCISKCAGGSGQALSGVLALAVGRPERRGQTVCLNSARPQVPRPQVQKPDNVVNTDTAVGRVHGLHCIPLAKVSCKASPDLSCGKTDFSLYGKSGRFFANDVGVGQEACGCFCKPSQYKAKVWSPRVDEGRPCRRGVVGGLSPVSLPFLATIRNGTQVSSPAVLMTEQSGDPVLPWGCCGPWALGGEG